MPKPFKLLYLVKCAPPQTFFDIVVIVYTGPNPDYEIRPRAGIKVADHWTYTDPMLKRRGDQPRLFSFMICALFNSLFLISAIRYFRPPTSDTFLNCLFFYGLHFASVYMSPRTSLETLVFIPCLACIERFSARSPLKGSLGYPFRIIHQDFARSPLFFYHSWNQNTKKVSMYACHFLISSNRLW